MRPVYTTLAGFLVLLLSLSSAAAQGGTPRVTHRAVLVTASGEIEMELYGEDAPKTVENFVKLAERGAYNNTLFHRVIAGVAIQGGDPLSRDPARRNEWGNGGQSCTGSPIADELNPGASSYQRGYVEGVVAMANRGPNTGTSQFFIMLSDNNRLPKPIERRFTIFGRVTRGMDVAQTIGRGALADQRRRLPANPVAITSVKVSVVK